MKNTEPLLWNTLDEAAAWLSDVRGETWTANKVIDAALRVYKEGPHHTPRPTLISAVLPYGCRYGVYVWDAAKGSPANPFVPKSKFPCAIRATNPVPLGQANLADILLRGKIEVSMLQHPGSPDGIEGEYHFIEPFGESVEVKVDMLGISGRKLKMLAKLLPDAETQKVETGQVSDALWDAMTSGEKKAAWKAMAPSQRRDKANELVKKYQGNKSAAGREVGVTGKWIAMLLDDAKKKSELEAPPSTKSNSGPFGLPQPKQGKASR